MLSLSTVVPIIYLSLPVGAIVWGTWRAKRTGNNTFLRETLLTFTMGIVGGMIVAGAYVRLKFALSPTEVALAFYWGIAVACVIRIFNVFLKSLLGAGVRLISRGRKKAGLDIASSVLRAILLLAFAIPYVEAMLLVWRPHVEPTTIPVALGNQPMQPVSFRTSDGLTIRGWWITAAHEQDDVESATPQVARRTILLCHDFYGNKSSDLKILRDLIHADFNVLTFDFRGHGQSDGELCTFGDLERRDVLAAVRWLRAKHPEESQKIFGVGVGLGSAALLAAAADPNEGQFIDAIALFAPYDTLDHEMGDLARANAVPVAGWLATHASLALAGAQLGTNLSHFSPAAMVDKIAPRPVFVIACYDDDVTQFSRSQAVFDAASQPKACYWISTGTRHQMLFKNPTVSQALRIFFETEREVL